MGGPDRWRLRLAGPCHPRACTKPGAQGAVDWDHHPVRRARDLHPDGEPGVVARRGPPLRGCRIARDRPCLSRESPTVHPLVRRALPATTVQRQRLMLSWTWRVSGKEFGEGTTIVLGQAFIQNNEEEIRAQVRAMVVPLEGSSMQM